ncbi:xylan 1,4-beta-xylosidase [Geomicrobium halophilum]|uniref:Xylan 1,4-beta-xylosidase n=1 Tax=Geomicrobium halophilum TaxID=549000 RepID=A0A841Q0T5_9BACL|nr:glycoside hydrolase family 43 protein [Geomicrobium halophilum]MBB6451312.1 xylan 1,4-beta-xylosidase [Geomicrobium halophilum]
MSMIENPILRGFYPDPSILRVKDNYYIATSTFEWFPGVRIYHSKDLKHWQFINSPLTRVSQLDMDGNVNSGGVWAPCLSYCNGLYYLIYTDVKSWHGAYKDTHNYLVTAEEITGPWSDPVYLNSSGFDPSLFHDTDGRKWLTNVVWDYRPENHSFGGILLQEYSEKEQKLVGGVKNIFKGTDIKLTEAPHIYKVNGYYYLLTAEGGTEYEHAATLARSKNIDGPYEVDDQYPLLTSAGRDDLPLQKAGHGSLVETQEGEWYLAHLCGRPLKDKYCTLGRETALQRCEWTNDGWLRLSHGGNAPSLHVKGLDVPEQPFEALPEKDNFDKPELRSEWNSLRIPAEPSWLSLTERPGYLRLKGMESLSSLHRQSLIARRQQAFHVEAETSVDFHPETFQQMAGLIFYYDTVDHVYLNITEREGLGKCIGIIQTKHGEYYELLERYIEIPEEPEVRLKAVVENEWLQLYYTLAQNEEKWKKIGNQIDVRHMSDDSAPHVRFTGTFIGMCCQDLSGGKIPADFDYFIYKEQTD